jgi:hypothetical protein
MAISRVSIQAHAYIQNNLTKDASMNFARITLNHIPAFSSPGEEHAKRLAIVLYLSWFTLPK